MERQSWLTYSNVVATLALFAALGGGAYAAVELPVGSVGPRQLRAGAVLPGALGFPLKVAGVTDTKLVDETQGGCNGGGFGSGAAVPPCLPGVRGGPTPGDEVSIRLRKPAKLLVSAIIGLIKRGLPTTYAGVEMGIVLDHRHDRYFPGERSVRLTGGQQIQVPLQALIPVPPGSHTIGVYADAEYFGSGPGDAFVGPISVIVTALPD